MTNLPLRFEIENNVIQSYKRLAYTPWHAIAEFVDNSTQSYFNNQELLKGLAIETPQLTHPLKVDIEYDAAKDFFRVTDNAMGMSFDELKHALHLSKPPHITSGRSQFGMGMKTAASWLGNKWIIKTKKHNDPNEYTVEIDVDRIATGNSDLEYSVRNNEIGLEDHYTIIEIYKHNRKFRTKTISKIAQYLRSMYRQDFRDKVMTLIWRGDELDWEEFDQRLAVDRSGEPYKRPFDFMVGTDIEDENDLKNKRVRGWIGILEKGSRRDAGLTVFHANRVIMGWPNTYRPEAIYGYERNDLLNQRLLGEIHLDDLLVSHTKDAIQWMGDQEEQIEEELKKLFKDYITYANEVRKGSEDSRGPSFSEKEIAVAELETELRSNELADAVNLAPILFEPMVRETTGAVIQAVSTTGEARFDIEIGSVNVKLYLDQDLSPNDPYLTVDASGADEVIIVVNDRHPHWYQIQGAEGILNFLRHCVYDGIAEWKARKKSATIDPDTIKIYKDGYLRIPMEIEKHK